MYLLLLTGSVRSRIFSSYLYNDICTLFSPKFHWPERAGNMKILKIYQSYSQSFHWKVALFCGKSLRKSLFWFSHTFSKISKWNSDKTLTILARPRHCQKSGEPNLRKYCLDLFQIIGKSVFKDPGSEFFCQLFLSRNLLVFSYRPVIFRVSGKALFLSFPGVSGQWNQFL